MKAIQAGTKVTISIKALYDKYGENLTDGHIEKTDDYYDLTSGGELVCMDGEECFISDINNGLCYLKNDCGDTTCYFYLTEEELKTATFN